MAVLTPPPASALLPGADRVLAALDPPQPDQLCGPFAARLALHALLDDPPPLWVLARAAGTTVWPHDLPESRPAGAALDTRCWEGLPTTDAPATSGTDAGPLARGLAAVAPVEVLAVPAVRDGETVPTRAWGVLLDGVRAAAEPVAVVANLRTGPTLPPGPAAGWDVGHFVVLWSWDGRTVGVADSYREVGEPGWPSACRGVALEALAAALAAPPGRGLLLVAREGQAAACLGAVHAAGLTLAGADRGW